MQWRSDLSEKSLKRSFIGGAKQRPCQQARKSIFVLLFLLRKKVINPNPAQEIFYLQSETDNSNWQLTLFDLSGRQIPIQTDFVNTKQIKISTQKLPDGLYLLHAGNSVQKILIRHE